MRVLVDTNILVDYYTKREPFFESATKVYELCSCGIEGFVAPHTLSNLHYILHAHAKFPAEKCRQAVADVLEVFALAQLSWQAAVDAIKNMSIPDFEDALQAKCAEECDAEYIITRNISDFKHSVVQAVLPSDFLEMV